MGDRMTFNNSPGVGFLVILRQSQRVSVLEKGDTDRVPGGWKKRKKNTSVALPLHQIPLC